MPGPNHVLYFLAGMRRMFAKRGFPNLSVPPRDAEFTGSDLYPNKSANSSDSLGNHDLVSDGGRMLSTRRRP